MTEGVRLNRDQIAKRVAAELQDGWLVNLGVGIPILAVNYIPEGRDVIFVTPPRPTSRIGLTTPWNSRAFRRA